MKKLTRLLVLVLSLALICGVFAVVALADTSTDTSNGDIATVADDNVYKVVSGTSVKYYTESTHLRTVFSEATAGSTIYLLRDVTVATSSSSTIVASRALTFDLGGNTLTLEQHSKNCGIYIKTTSTVTFKNGTISTVAHSDYNGTGRTFPIANISTSGAKVVFENINTNASSLMYSYSLPYTITVIGGRHVMNNGTADTNTSGYISGQSNITATVKGASAGML